MRFPSLNHSHDLSFPCFSLSDSDSQKSSSEMDPLCVFSFSLCVSFLLLKSTPLTLSEPKTVDKSSPDADPLLCTCSFSTCVSFSLLESNPLALSEPESMEGVVELKAGCELSWFESCPRCIPDEELGGEVVDAEALRAEALSDEERGGEVVDAEALGAKALSDEERGGEVVDVEALWVEALSDEEQGGEVVDAEALWAEALSDEERGGEVVDTEALWVEALSDEELGSEVVDAEALGVKALSDEEGGRMLSGDEVDPDSLPVLVFCFTLFFAIFLLALPVDAALVFMCLFITCIFTLSALSLIDCLLIFSSASFLSWCAFFFRPVPLLSSTTKLQFFL